MKDNIVFYWLFIACVVVISVLSVFVKEIILFLVLLIYPVVFFIVTCLIVLIIALITRDRKAIKITAMVMLPVFLFVSIPLILGYGIDKYRLYQAEKVINELESFKDKNGYYPESLHMLPRKFKYTFCYQDDEYKLEYERSFLFRAGYDSKTATWKNYE